MDAVTMAYLTHYYHLRLGEGLGHLRSHAERMMFRPLRPRIPSPSWTSACPTAGTASALGFLCISLPLRELVIC
jgi:hypothetical protein